ncbi:MAG: hypothetical protein M1827_001038 [Pycnora praestabilis]|nr:MAG: hypothetical protein M1827_001038 [Pycnora praestabilis]
MQFSTQAVTFLLVTLACVTAKPTFGITKPFDSFISHRQVAKNISSSLTVDLGYDVYEGYANTTSGLDIWRGIRFAAPPVGQLRWQAPQAPAVNRSQIIQANEPPPMCPQSWATPGPVDYNFTADTEGNEDCLFLDIYSPAGAANLPVVVIIHGGAYGLGSSSIYVGHPTQLMADNNNGFITVFVQYRLGAFGFLSSDEVHRFGAVNAGLLDQTFAFQWIQSYINLFGGNSSAVTIYGESAGGGSVLLHTIAYKGYQRDSLFNNVIAASPFTLPVYGYADFQPSQSYYRFAAAVGCIDSINTTAFDCLVSKDTLTLQNASNYVSSNVRSGQLAFLPVVDGLFVPGLPSQQLLKKQVNGVRVLSGNNANEGALYVPQTIVTEDDFVNYIKTYFPLFDNNDVAKILYYYPSTNGSSGGQGFATLGNSTPTALNESGFATGQQQRANNLYSEIVFDCPSYWLAEAFSADYGREAYKYQYSVPPAGHTADLNAVYSNYPFPAPELSRDFTRAFHVMYGNFIMNNDPTIPASIVAGTSGNGTTFEGKWPQFAPYNPLFVNFNETGGQPAQIPVPGFPDQVGSVGPGLVNEFTLANGYTWEGGRGVRCDFWRSMAEVVPA